MYPLKHFADTNSRGGHTPETMGLNMSPEICWLLCVPDGSPAALLLGPIQLETVPGSLPPWPWQAAVGKLGKLQPLSLLPAHLCLGCDCRLLESPCGGNAGASGLKPRALVPSPAISCVASVTWPSPSPVDSSVKGGRRRCFKGILGANTHCVLGLLQAASWALISSSH